MAVTAVSLPERRSGGFWGSPEASWGIIMVVPYVVIFFVFFVWPVAYGMWLGSDPQSYVRLGDDPI